MNRKMSVSIVAGTAFGLAGVAFGQANDSRAYSAELLADAEERSSLLQAGTSGYDDQFFIQSADGNFRLGIDGFTQFRYRLNIQDDATTNGFTPDSVENGFGIARTRLAFSGHAGSPSVRYRIEGSFGEENVTANPPVTGTGAANAVGGGIPGSGSGNVASFGLLDAFIEYEYSDSITLRAGQFRAPFLLERDIRPNAQQTIERSNMSRAFDLGFVQGIQAEYNTGDGWRARVAVHDGGNSVNSAALSGPISPATNAPNGTPSTTSQSDIAITGRFDYVVSGSMEQFDTYSSGPNGDSGLLLGGAAHIQFGEDGVSGPSQDMFMFTVDATYQSAGGWNIAGAFNFRTLEASAFNPNNVGGGQPVDTTDVGFLVQGGYWLADDIELYGRFDTAIADSANDLTTVTAGANFFPLADTQALRVSGEVQIFADGAAGSLPGGPSSLYGLGNSGSESSVGFASQIQLTF